MRIDIRKSFSLLFCALAFHLQAADSHLVLGLSGAISQRGNGPAPLPQTNESLKNCVKANAEGFTLASIAIGVQPGDCSFAVYDTDRVDGKISDSRKIIEDEIASAKADILKSFNNLTPTVIEQIKASVTQQVEQDVLNQVRRQAVLSGGKSAVPGRTSWIVALYGSGIFLLGLAVGGAVVWKYRA